jgi:hypothetical protein
VHIIAELVFIIDGAQTYVELNFLCSPKRISALVSTSVIDFLYGLWNDAMTKSVGKMF